MPNQDPIAPIQKRRRICGTTGQTSRRRQLSSRSRRRQNTWKWTEDSENNPMLKGSLVSGNGWCSSSILGHAQQGSSHHQDVSPQVHPSIASKWSRRTGLSIPRSRRVFVGNWTTSLRRLSSFLLASLLVQKKSGAI